MAFSGALTLTDLNDYLGPSQACIKPVEGKDAPEPLSASDLEGVGASTEIAIDESGDYYESSSKSQAAPAIGGTKQQQQQQQPRARTKLETAEISLNDCLACSGCVTSAESVLIGMQSTDELRRVVQEKRDSDGTATSRRRLVASISPQTLASLSARYSLPSTSKGKGESEQGGESFIPLHRLLYRIERYLTTKLDFDMVMDTTFARHLSLQEHIAEFQERKRSTEEVATRAKAEPLLPMLASACPGWICYAEKTHGELLPLISKTRSPQQMAGLLAKRYLYQQEKDTSVYHVTVMPCYDKKLEASRQDFFDDVTSTRDVDCVITTGELDGMMRDDGFDISAAIEGEDDQHYPSVHGKESDAVMTPPPSDSSCGDDMKVDTLQRTIPSMLRQPGSSSGSYLFELMRQIWLDHLSTLPSSSTSSLPKLSVRTIRSADYTEYILRAPPSSTPSPQQDSNPNPLATAGEILFKGAQCYGFRNLQNLVRKVQRQTGLKSKKAAAASRVDASFADDDVLPSRASAATGRGRGIKMNGAGRGGMVRRGRGGAAVSSTNGVGRTAEKVVSLSPEEEEEARPYDYVEVMACPGGCVNGGGQLRPPTGAANGVVEMQSNNSLTARTISTEVTEAIREETSVAQHPTAAQVDPEGFTNGWAATNAEQNRVAGQEDDEGMDIDDVEEHKIQQSGWQGTSKDWVRRVERAYWSDDSVAVQEAGEGTTEASSTEAGGAAAASPHGIQALQGNGANLSQGILKTLIKSVEASRAAGRTGNEVDILIDAVRRQLCSGKGSETLRTEYRGIQDEAVSGLAVQW